MSFDWFYWLSRYIALALGVIFGSGLFGCQGAPQYAGVRTKADSELSLGWGRSLRLGPEVDAELHGLKTANGSTIESLTFKQSPAATMANGWAPAMNAYVSQQQAFVPILKQYGDNFVNGATAVFSGLNQIAQTVMPTVGQYLAGKNMMAQAEQQKQQIFGEIIGATVSGKVNPQAILPQLPPDWQKELEGRLQAATSQPAN